MEDHRLYNFKVLNGVKYLNLYTNDGLQYKFLKLYYCRYPIQVITVTLMLVPHSSTVFKVPVTITTKFKNLNYFDENMRIPPHVLCLILRNILYTYIYVSYPQRLYIKKC